MQVLDALIYDATLAGQIYRTAPITIPGLEEARPLTLYLPPGYDDSDEYYPVAYLFDGQNIYDDEGTLAGGWNLHQVLDQRATLGLTVPIVVGIHHGIMRDEELCPWPAEPGQTPRGDDLLEWIVSDLHEQIQEQLRILEGPENTLLGGASLGGLLALYGFFRHNEVFGKALVMSPSLWVGDGAIFEFVEQSSAVNSDSRLYLDCGFFEDDDEDEELPVHHDHFLAEELDNAIYLDNEPAQDDTDTFADAEKMAGLLVAKGLVHGQHFLWVPDPDGEHNEWHWGKRLPLALNFLYDDD